MEDSLYNRFESGKISWLPSNYNHSWNILNMICAVLSRSGVSNSLWPHGLLPTRLLCPCGSSRQEYWSGLHAFLQGIFPTQGLNPSLSHCRRIVYYLSHQGSYCKQSCGKRGVTEKWLYPDGGWLDHMAVLFCFWDPSPLFLAVVVPIYIPTNSAQGFPFPPRPHQCKLFSSLW